MAKNVSEKKTRAKRKIAREAQKQRQIGLQWSILAVVALIVAAIFLWPKPQSQAINAERLNTYPSQGSSNPMVTIVEFADFGCPSCRAWHQAGIMEQVIKTYGDKVRFVWRDFPVITAQSPKAAEAGQCALDQAKFWEYHDLVYKQGKLGISDLKSYAQDLDLDTQMFNQCLDSGQYRASIDQSLNSARELRLRGTPSFLVNDIVLPGPPSYAQLAALIEADLKAN